MDSRSAQGNQERYTLEGRNSFGGSTGHPAPPAEPGIRQRMKEAIGYLRELEHIQGEINEVTCSHFPKGNPVDQAADSSNPRELPIEDLAAEICQRAACLLGQATGILNRI